MSYGYNAKASIFGIVPVGAHTRTGTDAVVTLTCPENASILLVEGSVASCRYTLDGSNPTVDIGFLLEPADNVARIDLFPGATVKILGTGGFINYQWARTRV